MSGADLLRHGARSAGEVAARARTLGVPLRSRRLLGVVLRPRMSGTDGIASLAVLRNLAEQFAAAARAAYVMPRPSLSAPSRCVSACWRTEPKVALSTLRAIWGRKSNPASDWAIE